MAKSESIKFSYNVFESKTGSDANLTPIILLHAMSLSKEMWDNISQIIANKTKRKVYTYDARNHGDSEYTDEFNYSILVDDLFDFMDQRNIQKAVLIGHTMGGFTATSAALKNPEKVEMVFSVDMFINKVPNEFYPMVIQSLLARKESLPYIPKDMDEKGAVQFSFQYMIDHMPPDFPWAKMLQKEDVERMKVHLKRKPDGTYDLGFNVDALIKAMKDPENFMKDPSGLFSGLAYFLYANKSPLKINEHEENIREHFPNAEFIVFDGKTHIDYTEDKFIDAILSPLQN